ncbi:MAG: lipopolysaccharide glycosyltransferase, putative [Dehalococcoidia bacterium]|nr:MAG: lipopolysaccharide glycosyltransferase, putative [Dehalococcoidia bacterium]
MNGVISVLLTTEGTYPYAEGGVSTWCHALVSNLPEVRFVVLALIAQPGLRPVYPLPPNVQVLPVPLWGTGAANEMRRDLGLVKLHRMRQASVQRAVKAAFQAAFDLFLEGLLADRPRPELAGEGLRRLAILFEEHDYDQIFREAVAWETFRHHAIRFHREQTLAALLRRGRIPKGEDELAAPPVGDLVDALRLLYRWLTPIAQPFPRTTVVHASAAGFASLPGIVARLRYGTPFVLTEHGIYLRERLIAWNQAGWPPFLKQFAARVTRRLVELSYLTADLIAPVSRWNTRWEQQLGASADRILPIANGVDQHRFSPQPFPPFDQPTAVWVGRIDPLKDLLTLVDAMAIVREALPNARLLLFGKAPEGNEGYAASVRQRVAQLGLEDVVRFLGFAASPEQAYAQGHLMVLSSISEGQPYSVIEAMLCGRAVVGTEVGGVPEMISECGSVVPPRDRRALAQALISLLSDPARCQALGAAARRIALERYTLDQFVAAYRTVYRAALDWMTQGPAFDVPTGLEVQPVLATPTAEDQSKGLRRLLLGLGKHDR